VGGPFQVFGVGYLDFGRQEFDFLLVIGQETTIPGLDDTSQPQEPSASTTSSEAMRHYYVYPRLDTFSS
jgi:hypothetical protein